MGAYKEVLRLQPSIPCSQSIILSGFLGNQRKALKSGDASKVCFAICEGDEVETVYAYCNLRSLWRGYELFCILIIKFLF